MLITEMIKQLEALKQVYGDLPVVKWEQDSTLRPVEKENVQLIVNDDFNVTRYATHLAIK